MATILLVIHVLIALGIIATVLLQRSEGGALGIGGGGGGMKSGRGSGNLLSRTTAILAACFFASSIGLTVLARTTTTNESKIDSIKVDGPKKSGKVLDGIPTPPAAPKKLDGPVVPIPDAPKK